MVLQNISLPEPVLWYEGMPLLPHHFQQDFVYHQTVSHIQLQLMGGFNYGVLELEIDNLSLIKKIFKINKIFAIMPDGAMVKIENHPHYNLEYPLPSPEEFDKNDLSVYLTIPKLISNNYFSGKYPRYKREQYFDVTDIYSGEDPIEVSKMLPNIEVHSDLDLNSNYTTLKIAKLTVDKNLWSLSEYYPATVQITTNSPVHTLCSEIAYLIRKKINYLAELLNSKSSNSHSNFISENLFYAQGLGMGIPILEGLLTSQKAHPFQLYLSLCNILGGLGLLTNQLTPPTPYVYQHEDLLTTFQKMKSEILGIINSMIDEKIMLVYFTNENKIFMANALKEHLFNDSFMIGFKKKPGCLEKDFLMWIKNAIICDSKKVDVTLQNRILGYQRTHLERTEDIIPTKGVYLFKVTPDNIKDEFDKLSILNYDDSQNTPDEIFVFVKKQKV